MVHRRLSIVDDVPMIHPCTDVGDTLSFLAISVRNLYNCQNWYLRSSHRNYRQSNLDESRNVPLPKTRFEGNPESFQVIYAKISAGLDTTIMITSGDKATILGTICLKMATLRSTRDNLDSPGCIKQDMSRYILFIPLFKKFEIKISDERRQTISKRAYILTCACSYYADIGVFRLRIILAGSFNVTRKK